MSHAPVPGPTGSGVRPEAVTAMAMPRECDSRDAAVGDAPRLWWCVFHDHLAAGPQESVFATGLVVAGPDMASPDRPLTVLREPAASTAGGGPVRVAVADVVDIWPPPAESHPDIRREC